jgi:hypothetical protein
VSIIKKNSHSQKLGNDENIIEFQNKDLKEKLKFIREF